MGTATKKTRRKRCSECGELKGSVAGRQNLCDECEQGRTYCTVCDEWKDRAWGGGCRHVGWSDELGMECGCGASELTAEDHRDSFALLLSKFAALKVHDWDKPPRPLLPDMLTLIEANNFWTTWHGPMIGGPPDLALRYEKVFPTHTANVTLKDIYASEQESWGAEAIEEMQLGMAWLTSLDDTTKDANRITAGWIRQFPNPEA